MDTNDYWQGLMMDLGDEPTIRKTIRLYGTVGMPARNLAQRTRVEYGKDLRDLADFLEARQVLMVEQVTLDHLEAYLAEMDHRGLASSTRQRRTYAIRSFFTFLHGKGLVRENVGKRLIPPRRVQKEPRFLTKTEYQALLLACKHHPRDAAIIELFLQTALRISELSRLTLDDIVELPARPSRDTGSMGLLRVTRKGGKQQTLPLNYKACLALQGYLKVRPEVAGRAIFLSKYRQPLTSQGIRAAVKRHMLEAGITDASAHALRHTMLTHHAAQGTDLKSLQSMAGHADISTTALYLHLAKRAQRKALQENAL